MVAPTRTTAARAMLPLRAVAPLVGAGAADDDAGAGEDAADEDAPDEAAVLLTAVDCGYEFRYAGSTRSNSQSSACKELNNPSSKHLRWLRIHWRVWWKQLKC